LVINAARKKPPQRYQLDHTIHQAQLRSVDFTAAAKDNFFPPAVDATACRNESLLVLAVYVTSASCA